MVKETVSYMHTAVAENKRILVECAQSTILDIDFGKKTASLVNFCININY